MSRRENIDSDRQAAATAQKKPWVAPMAEAQPVRSITRAGGSPNPDGGGCHS